MMTVANSPNVVTSRVAKVYSGAARGCMCGCKGKYTYASGTPREEWQGKANDRVVAQMVAKMNAQPSRTFADNGAYAFVVVGDRQYVAYFA